MDGKNTPNIKEGFTNASVISASLNADAVEMQFSDPFVSHWEHYGQLLIKLPKVDLKLLEILTKERKNIVESAIVKDILQS